MMNIYFARSQFAVFVLLFLSQIERLKLDNGIAIALRFKHSTGTKIAVVKKPKIVTARSIANKLIFILSLSLCSISHAMAPKLDWNKSIEHVIHRYGLPVEPQLKERFTSKGISYPPKDVALLAFKKEQKIQLWAKNEGQSWRMIHQYPLTAYSGRLGPKLRENDRQIPEGIYRLTSFNPFSSMHLSMMINYPNNFDRLQASKEGRRRLGNNIFLHGKSFSVGCLAVGDKAIDELFLLTYRVGLGHVRVIIAPNDLRHAKPATPTFAQPRWIPELYKQIAQELNQFPQLKYA